jgi:hypothetical protein
MANNPRRIDKLRRKGVRVVCHDFPAIRAANRFLPVSVAMIASHALI